MLYGRAGSGKSTIAASIADHSDYFFYEADNDITEDMRQALANQQPFTDAMRDAFVAQLIEHIQRLKLKHKKIVVAQGLYKQRHRQQIEAAIESCDAICVETDEQAILHRLGTRQGGISSASAAALKADFQKPLAEQKTLLNNTGMSDVFTQLRAWYN